MTTPTKKRNRSGSVRLFNWCWITLLALLACFLANRATAGTLTVTSSPVLTPTAFNLSAEGDLDWAKWGTFAVTDFDHKTNVTSQIPNYTPYGAGSYGSYGGDNNQCSWIDGTVDHSESSVGNAIWASPPTTGAGFQLSIPASTTPVILHLYLGGWQATGNLELSLSDNSATAYTNVLPLGTSWRYNVTFAANSSGQTLNVNYYGSLPGLSYGNVTIQAATLSSAAALPLNVPQPTLSSGSSVKAGSVFYLSANPTGVDANGNTAFAYQWQVDNGGGYVDIAGGTRNPLQVTAGALGNYNYRVVVTNSVLASAVTSAPVALTVTAPTGTLGVSAGVVPAPVFPSTTPNNIDLTTEGITDWAYWGFSGPDAYDTKAGIIPNFTQIGSGSESQLLPGSVASFSWTDATTANTDSGGPTTVTAGMPVDNGYQLSIPASTTPKLVNIYVSTGNGLAHVEASMSDNSSPVFVDYPATAFGTLRYAIAFSSASAGQTLNVKVTQASRTANGGLVSLQAASLAPVPSLGVTIASSTGTSVLENQPIVLTASVVGAPPFTYVWQRNAGTGFTNIPNATGSSLAFTAQGTVGTESYQVIVSGSQGSAPSAPITFNVGAATGLLKLLSVVLNPPGPNLTQEGSLDWSHWGFSAATDFDQKQIGGNPVNLIGNLTLLGTSSSLSRYGSGVTYKWYDGTPHLAATNNGGVYRFPAGNGFEVDAAAATTNRLLHVYVGSYQAQIHVEAYLSDSSALKLIDESIPAGGNGEYNIEFAAGSPGQHLVFQTWFTSSGNVTISAASLEGVPLLAVGTPTVSPSSTVPAGSTITLQAQGAAGVPPLKFQWQVDTGGGYVNIAGATNQNTTTSAGSTTGSINFRTIVTDVTGSVTSAPVALTVTVPTSTLVGSRTISDGKHYNLTAEGSLDWVKWGAGGVLDQKSTLPGLISPFSIIGAGSILSYGGGVFYSWTDGAITPVVVDNTTGIYIVGAGNGFEVDAPAATTNRVFTIYNGVYQATMHMEAFMSDNSAPIYADETLTAGSGSIDGRWSFTYSSPNPGAYLRVRFWDLVGANDTLQAASLGVPNVLNVQPVGGGQLQLTWPAGVLLEAPAVDGPWTTNNATSPYTFTPSGAQKFFRAIQ
jgi:hypothetical protein